MQEAIAKRVHAVLSYGLQLKERLERGEEPVFETEHGMLKELLLTEVEARRWADYGGDTDLSLVRDRDSSAVDERQRTAELFLGIRYALVCWLDELFILYSPWESQWNNHKLEAALYGTNDRAWRFWEQAKRAESRPEGDALEVFFLCVMLGFRGDWREEPEKLQNWVAATRTRMLKGLELEWQGPPELEPPIHVPPLYGRRRMQRMIFVGGLLLLLIVPPVAFFALQQLNS